MKQVKCPQCSLWYHVEVGCHKYSYVCPHCTSFYAVKTSEQLIHEEEMRAPVSKPPLSWKHWGQLHWTLVILNNVGVIFQTIIFAIATIIGILVAPL
ncbi:MAG: hypothetical protein CMP53_01115 [Flavobacteriales bacterium]|nr:hypothetical protein [Flavobacteriales bacterium]